jgi:hypothetical protein
LLSEYWQRRVEGKKTIQTKEGEGTEDEGEEGEEVLVDYVVEKIVDAYKDQGVVYFCVKWKGYAELCNVPKEQFDPEEDLLIANYWKKCFFSKK